MEFNGIKVEEPILFSFKYWMHSIAVFWSSTIIASKFLPKIIETAISNLRWIGLHKSNTLPWTPFHYIINQKKKKKKKKNFNINSFKKKLLL